MEPYDFILEKAREAGDMIARLRAEGFETHAKGGDPRDVVTSVDLKVSEFLAGEIRKSFPGHGIYSEEGGGTGGKGEFLWVIDPIDGTANFSRGIPHFAVCLGLLEKNAPIAGAVYNPVTRELFSFKKGEGASLNGAPIRVSSVAELSNAGVFLHAGRKKELWSWGGSSYAALLERAHKTSNFGSSALDVCFVAAGRIEAAVYGTLSTMDVAAALGILAEAGGAALAASGEPARLSPEPQKLYAANSEALARELIALLER